MAINPSNSNAISVNSLPQAQAAVSGDLLILQTTNGTQTIDFKNFNVVKTDVNGNATVLGNLSGNNCTFANVLMNSVSGTTFYSNVGPGIDASNDYYDRFTVQGGIVLSATSNPTNNPVYTTIVNSIIPSVTSTMLNQFHQTADEYGQATFFAGQSTATVIVNNFFGKYPGLSVYSISPFHISFMPSIPSFDISASTINNLSTLANQVTGITTGQQTFVSGVTSLVTTIPSLSVVPVTPGLLANSIATTDGGQSLTFGISLPFAAPTQFNVFWRVFVTGTAIY